jgi:CRP-like cAMP-binding protein
MQTETLASLPLFAGLEAHHLQRLAQLFTVSDYAAGVLIFAAGGRADHLYIVQAGEVVIRYQPHDGGSLDIATIRAGEAFGWSAALKRPYYTASAVSVTAVQALTIRARELHRVMASDPQIGSVLLERATRMAGTRVDDLGQQVIELLTPLPPKRPPSAG